MSTIAYIGLVIGLMLVMLVIRFAVRKATNKVYDAASNSWARRKNANSTQEPRKLKDIHDNQD